MNDKEWDGLVDSIVHGTCTPFLGAGIGVPTLSTGATLARRLAKQFEYPFRDTHNLPRVTQFVATSHQGSEFPKRQVIERLKKESTAVEEIPANYRLLAELRLPIYVTTNYDDFLSRALPAQPDVPVVSRWNEELMENHRPYAFDPPTAETPLVFYMHGHVRDEKSLLLTEDDYIDFTVSLARDTDENPWVIPHQVTRALSWNRLLFVGYSLEDWNFRVLMRSLLSSKTRRRAPRGLSIQIAPSKGTVLANRHDDALKFLADYLELDQIDIEWVSAGDFLEELAGRVAERRDRP
jgi:hypothetical protein